jgi:hypothetical protein
MEIIRNEDGTPFTTKAGQFTRFNKDTEMNQIPGVTVFIRGNTLYRDRDTITPYVTDIKLVERNGSYVFVQLGSDWYTFPIKTDSEGKEYFTTAHFHKVGVNDTESMAYSEFISTVHAAKEAMKAAAARAADQKEADRLQVEHDQRIAEVRTLKLETQKKIQALTSGKSAAKIVDNKEIRSLMNDYLFLEMILKIRAL